MNKAKDHEGIGRSPEDHERFRADMERIARGRRFVPVQIHVRGGMGWKAWNDTGASCLHEHRSERAAQRCCDALNKPTPTPGTPRGAYDHAAGYHE